MKGKSKKAAVVVLAVVLIQNSVWVSAGETDIMTQEGITLQMDGVPAEQAEEPAPEEVSDMVSESVPEAEPQIPMQTEEQEASPEAEENPQEPSKEHLEPEAENAYEYVLVGSSIAVCVIRVPSLSVRGVSRRCRKIICSLSSLNAVVVINVWRASEESLRKFTLCHRPVFPFAR